MSSEYLYMDVPYSQEMLLALRSEIRKEFLKKSLIEKVRNAILRNKDGVFNFHSLNTDNLETMFSREFPTETRRMILWLVLGAEMTVKSHQKDTPRWRNTKTTLGMEPLKDELIKEMSSLLHPLKVFILLSYDPAKLLFTLRVNYGKNAEEMIEAKREKRQAKISKSRCFSEEDEAKLEIAKDIGDYLKESLSTIIADCAKDGLVKESETDVIMKKLMATFADALIS